MQAELITYVDKRFLEMDGVGRKMRYKIPFYDHGTWICYLNPVRQSHVELCFLKGQPLVNAYPVLDMRGRKMVAGLMLDPEADIPIDMAIDILNMAISLNRES